MKVAHDTTHPNRDGFTVSTAVHQVPGNEPMVHLILRRGGATIDLPIDEARVVVGLLVEQINCIDTGAWVDDACSGEIRQA